jgi:hypothetical protein
MGRGSHYKQGIAPTHREANKPHLIARPPETQERPIVEDVPLKEVKEPPRTPRVKIQVI